MISATVRTATEPPAGPPGLSSLPLRVEIWDQSRTQESMELWRRLETELQHDRLTSSTDWVRTWIQHYSGLVSPRIVIGRRGTKVIGLALAAVCPAPQAGPLTIRTWHLGTSGDPGDDSVCVEFNTLLVRPEDRDEFCRELQQTLLQRSDCDAVAWDGFGLTDLPEEFTASSAWQTRIKPTYYFDLRRAREAHVEPITLLGDSTRKGIRQNLRAAGDLHVDWSETPDQAEEFYAELIGFHQARWQAAGEPGSFSSRVFRTFHQELLQRLVPTKRAAIVRVRSAGRTIGCTLLYIDRGRALVYQGGWANGATLKSPGLINDYCCLSECLRRGYDAYDFMAGDSVHKRRLTTDQGRLVWATYRKTLWKFQAVDRLRAAKRFCRSFWSQPVPQHNSHLATVPAETTTEAAS